MEALGSLLDLASLRLYESGRLPIKVFSHPASSLLCGNKQVGRTARKRRRLRIHAEAFTAGNGSVGCQDSNSVRAMPLCRMIERSVPMASSG